jgi:pimeloyl-ACP methyl ester carboxylesterase
MGTQAALLGITLLLGAVPDAAPLTPGEFRGWFEAASRGRLRVPESVARRARGFRYVFVGGFQNERMPGYFSQNAKELRAHGVPRRSIHFLFPGSQATVEENRAAVRDEFLRIAGAGPEPLVVIAHSRGACDALAFALHDPRFVGDRVAALFLVQAPFGGTGLADYALGEGHPMDRRMPPGHRLFATLLGRVEKALRERGWHGGLTGLTRDASRAYWRRTLQEHAGAIPVVGPKVYYIGSRTRPARLRFLQRSAAWYLRTYYGPNDGVVALDDQALPGLGTRLVTLDAGHPDLTRRFPAARAGRRARQALTRSILMAVGRPAAGSPARPTGR